MNNYIDLGNGVKYSSTTHRFKVENLLLIRQFTDTSIFSTHPKNRDFKPEHIKNIAKAYINGGYLPPIEVNVNTGYVLDGNHRIMGYRSAQEKGYDKPIEVHFINVAPEDELKYMITRNNTAKSWNLSDYLNAYREDGNAYDKFIKICLSEEYPLLHKVNRDGKKTIKGRYFGQLCFGRVVDNDYIITGMLDKYLTPSVIKRGFVNYKEIEKVVTNLGVKDSMGSSFEQMINGWMKAKEEFPKDYLRKYFNGDWNEVIKTINQKDFYDNSTCTSGVIWKSRFITHFYNTMNKINKTNVA